MIPDIAHVAPPDIAIVAAPDIVILVAPDIVILVAPYIVILGLDPRIGRPGMAIGSFPPCGESDAMRVSPRERGAIARNDE